MNDDVVDDCSLKESEPFKKQYAAVLVQLQEANEQACSVPSFDFTWFLFSSGINFFFRSLLELHSPL